MSERQFETLRRDFTAEEIAQKHEKLVVKVGEVKSLREQKASMVSTINNQIKQSEKDVWDLQGNLETGYEMIEVEVFELMDDPRAGWKTVIRSDTNERLRELPMSARERQQNLFTDLPDRAPAEDGEDGEKGEKGLNRG